MHIDDEMMTEIKELHAAINPVETLFVVDSMTGQDAANTAKAFNDALPLTGVVLTKQMVMRVVGRLYLFVILRASPLSLLGSVKNQML